MRPLAKIAILRLLSALALRVHASHVLFARSSITTLECASYHGHLRGADIFVLDDEACVAAATASLDTGSLVSAPDGKIGEDWLLIHVEPAAVDFETPDWTSSLLQTLLSQSQRAADSRQAVFRHTALRLVHISRDDRQGAFLTVARADYRHAVSALERDPYSVIRLVSPQPLPRPAAFGGSAVPLADRERVQSYVDNISYEPKIQRIVDAAFANESSLRADATWLSGESPHSPIRSRHSLHPDLRRAGDWVIEQAQGSEQDENGRFAPTCERFTFWPGFGPSVICRYPYFGHEEKPSTVLMAAHLDSRGSFGYIRAPGADDDGSGSTMLIAVARSIREARIRFTESQVVLAWFTGEEAGLVGSRAYAAKLKQEGVDLKLMVQADMIAYRKPGEPLQLAFPDVHSIPEGRWLVGNLSTLYAPALQVGITPACCSDSQSFDDLGMASTWVFERNAGIADPFYHHSGDLVHREGYSFEQLSLIGKAYYATLLTLAAPA